MDLDWLSPQRFKSTFCHSIMSHFKMLNISLNTFISNINYSFHITSTLTWSLLEDMPGKAPRLPPGSCLAWWTPITFNQMQLFDRVHECTVCSSTICFSTVLSSENSKYQPVSEFWRLESFLGRNYYVIWHLKIMGRNSLKNTLWASFKGCYLCVNT